MNLDTRGAIAHGIFRANPRYELVLADRLSAGEREVLAASEVAELYGVLRPRAGETAEVRAVTSDTALLFLTLSDPAPLPGYVRARLGRDLARTIARLVVDSVLELEHEGRFVGGSAAAELVLPDRSSGGRGRIGELSVNALRYGQELVGLPVSELALRLYTYGRRPLPRGTLPALGFLAGPPAAGWVETTGRVDGRAYWRSWRARQAGDVNQADAGYKLYVSSAVDAVPRAVEAVVTTLAGSGARAFKVGADLGGLCRPDKLVVYFDRLDDLQAAASVLERQLDGCPAHGVPFTAAITSDGLLSWGADPPTLRAETGGLTSWRLWVSGLLADYLTAARAEAGSIEPWQFALERLRLGGIDTDTWVPVSSMWREAAEHA